MKMTSSGPLLVAALVAIFNVTLALQGMDEVQARVMYETDGDGRVTVDLFDETPQRMNLVPVIGTFNPSPRLAKCSLLGEGRFPVLGNCSRFLECTAQEDNTFRRRIVECPTGLWFRHDTSDCGVRDGDECPYGRLVPNPVLVPTASPQSRDEAAGVCVRDGQFALPGCHGYYSCRATAQKGEFHRYTYQCAEHQRWDQSPDTDYCVPAKQVLCDVPEEDTACLRECVAGQSRVCRYTFIVEEFASMSSIYCKNCPFSLADCDLPGCISAGCVTKPVVAINRKVPGPAIQVCKGDTIEVDVQNRLGASSVTLHWHGLHQRTTPHMDGVPFVTQCPIPPHTSFRYNMLADVSGTHLYHSHVGHEESDGMFGAMIVREPRSNELGIAARYDEDLPQHSMIIWHWFPRSADVQSIDMRYMSLRREGFGFIINGKGAVKKTFSERGIEVPTPVATFQVKTGLRYRFRSIFNSALNCLIQVSVDGHVLDVLANDGRPVQRHQRSLVDSFFLGAGERVDFVASAHWSVNTTGRSFYVRVRGLGDCDDNKNGVHQHAVLRYDGATATPEAGTWGAPSYANAIRSGVGYNLHRDLLNMNNYYIQARPLHTSKDANTEADTRISGTPNKTFYVDVRINVYAETENIRFPYPQLNNISFSTPPFPVLTQPESITATTFCKPGAPRNCQNDRCQCAQLLEASTGDLVEVVLVDTGRDPDMAHPFHLHGYSFRVVATGLYDEPTSVAAVRASNEQGHIAKTFNGPLKDVVTVPGRGFVAFRFVADNPGYWLFHCHISEHMAQGMALLLKVGQHAQMVRPPADFPKCGNFY